MEYGSSYTLIQLAANGMFMYKVLSVERALVPLKSQHLSLPVSLLQLLCFLKTIIAGEFLDVCDSVNVNSFKLLNH